jgi:hypothetical protein
MPAIRGDLRFHPAAAERVARTEHGGARIGAVGDHDTLVEDARNGREEDEQPCAQQHCDLRRERIVVAEADLVRRRRVVLVHDRHGA